MKNKIRIPVLALPALILFLLALASCSAQPPKPQIVTPPPKLVWTHKKLYSEAKAEKISWESVNQQYLIDFNVCKIQGLQVPIPSPSCSTMPAPTCYGQQGFALGVCQAQRPYQKCDYSSVDAANDAQIQIRDGCMNIKGWSLVRENLEPIEKKISLAELYSSSPANQHIIKELKLNSLDAIDNESKKMAGRFRWKLIHYDEEYLSGTPEFREATKDEFLKLNIGEMQSEDDSLSATRYTLDVLDEWLFARDRKQAGEQTLVEKYETAPFNQEIMEKLKVRSLENLNQNNKKFSVLMRWDFIRNDNSYISGSTAYRFVVRDEFFKKFVSNLYPPQDFDAARDYFESLDAALLAEMNELSALPH